MNFIRKEANMYTRKFITALFIALALIAGLVVLAERTNPVPLERALESTLVPSGPTADMTLEELNKSGYRPPPPPSVAGTDPASFHAWSLASESTHYGSYVGTHSAKSPDIVTGLGTGVCTGPLYYPTWLHLQFVDGQRGWIEMGIAHLCSGHRMYYGFAAKNFNYQAPYGTLEGGVWTIWEAIPAHEQSQHNFMEQYRDGDTGAGCAWWGQKINGVLRGTMNFGMCAIGLYYDTGFESYRDWGFNYGPGALSTYNAGLVWNGVPGSGRVWEWANWDSTLVDYQMHGRFGLQGGYPYSDWACAKQNHAISPPSC